MQLSCWLDCFSKILSSTFPCLVQRRGGGGKEGDLSPLEKRQFNSTLTLGDALFFISLVISSARKWRNDDNKDIVQAFKEFEISLEVRES